MSKSTILGQGHIQMSDEIVVWLIEADHNPPLVTDEAPRTVIAWPPHATICTPEKLAEVAAAAMRILANASTELSRIKAGKHR
jgi:hypothetical protein